MVASQINHPEMSLNDAWIAVDLGFAYSDTRIKQLRDSYYCAIKTSPFEFIVKVKGSCSSGKESAELSGKST